MNHLFRKKMEPRCAYCKRGDMLNSDNVICGRHGVVAVHAACRSFVYDPLKRVPAPQARLKTGYTEEDLRL
ncbi:MAG: hypothetical protein FWG93_04090 [Oscillospiraceae bacterium]|nr:hypothetical protein [Oscillospiraceae bacterium]